MGEPFVPQYSKLFKFDLLLFKDKNNREADELCIVMTPNNIESKESKEEILHETKQLRVHYSLGMPDKGELQDLLSKKSYYFEDGYFNVAYYNFKTLKNDYDIRKTTVPTYSLNNGITRPWYNDAKAKSFIDKCIEEIDKFKRTNAVSKEDKINKAVKIITNAKSVLKEDREQKLLYGVVNAVQIMAEVEYPHLTGSVLIDQENDIDDILMTKFIFTPSEKYRSWKPLLHIWYIFNASIIAGVGLASNSAPVVVASMLVSSMMEPIKGITTAVRHCFTSKKSSMATQIQRGCNHFLTLIFDTALCVLVGLGMGTYMYHSPDENDSRARVEILSNIIKNNNETGLILPDEMAGRATELGLTVTCLIAAASAAALVTADQSDNKSALIGIGISASLLPPAVNAGMLWAFNIWLEEKTPVGGKDTFERLGGLSLALTFINIVIIVVIWSIGHGIRECVNISRMKKKRLLTTTANSKRSLATKENPIRAASAPESTPLMLDF